MFSLLWRFFPGPAWLRVIVLIIALAALVYALITYVYPWVALQMPEQEVTVDS
ncbi:hypothetical protein [Leucobacter ruminantium]|uniref:DUF4175 domain-containing protein n=1 Tax=Leucobacter ruminantium TaxID=1289170 RepID=A0A939RV24_9MICO|nr:hypothetical protein [Leucobacter ruminantium]MBO1806450.1 hypothetical protein [Leucobacter ruminantium]